MRKFALEIVNQNNPREWVYIAHKQICPLAAGKGSFALPVDWPVNRPTVTFLTVVPAVDRPVDRA